MIVNIGVENIKERCANEFSYFALKKYPTVAFNIYNWLPVINDRKHGKNILFATESYINIPGNYDPNNIKKYDAYITNNRKFKEMYPELNIYVTSGPPVWEGYYELETFIPYEDKIRGVCSLQRVYDTGMECDINFMKHTVMRDLKTEPHLVLHTYGPAPFGKEGAYRGTVGEHHHSHYDNLKKINEYLFCWCPDPLYHPIWSYDFVTERVFNCFKSKTVVVYYGCYNVEDLIPKELFVDFRDFNGLDELSEFLIDLSNDKDRYNYMIETAYTWNLTNKIGSMCEVEKVIKECVSTYKL